MEEKRALEWKTKGNPKERAEASEEVAHIFEFAAAYSEKTSFYYLSPIFEGAAKMCILDKYLLLKEAGEQLPVPEILIDVSTEVVPMPTKKQKFWRDYLLDKAYDESKDWEY